ncbi:hypothetical protein RHM62_01040 [Actimicrobium sp. CCC2.4]|uniref:hypothetical protein n=1 Tax=Actimicrobium sp. CCC2.4 TaxID=3048606 RepID=UPI002AC99590|nr:hypothetical protein [Actimicrobium sp. CCC2.4]WPX32463.1 hypothetical protein RHM62_01040 [Actimicrobium sp. CCC2.4]
MDNKDKTESLTVQDIEGKLVVLKGIAEEEDKLLGLKTDASPKADPPMTTPSGSPKPPGPAADAGNPASIRAGGSPQASASAPRGTTSDSPSGGNPEGDQRPKDQKGDTPLKSGGDGSIPFGVFGSETHQSGSPKKPASVNSDGASEVGTPPSSPPASRPVSPSGTPSSQQPERHFSGPCLLAYEEATESDSEGSGDHTPVHRNPRTDSKVPVGGHGPEDIPSSAVIPPTPSLPLIRTAGPFVGGPQPVGRTGSFVAMKEVLSESATSAQLKSGITSSATASRLANVAPTAQPGAGASLPAAAAANLVAMRANAERVVAEHAAAELARQPAVVAPRTASDPIFTVESVGDELKDCRDAIQNHAKATPDQSASVTTALTDLIAELQARIAEVNNLQPLPEPPSKSDRAVRDLQLMMLCTSAGLAAENFRRLKFGYSPQDYFPLPSEKISESNLKNGLVLGLPTFKSTSGFDESILIQEMTLGNEKQNELGKNFLSVIQQSKIAKEMILEERKSSIKTYEAIKAGFKRINQEMDFINGNSDVKLFCQVARDGWVLDKSSELFNKIDTLKKWTADMVKIKEKIDNYNIPDGDANKDIEGIRKDNEDIENKVNQFNYAYQELNKRASEISLEFDALKK